jgi:ABC-2 type transport system permease protein
MLIWAATAAVLLTYGGTLLGLVGADPSLVATIQTARALPDVPLSAGIIFILCFAGGFFLFATLYAVVGSAITSTQEAQGLVMPIILPFMFGLFIAMSAGENPNSGLAIAGTYIPLTSPVILPVRALSGEVGWLEAAASLAILFATALFIIWAAAKIYRIAIFATGKKPTWVELLRWARAA